MDAWCRSCHGTIHDKKVKTQKFKHPVVKKLGPTQVASYGSSYNPSVPLEGPGNSVSGSGVPGDSEVFCLSCHRAHVGRYDCSARWDFAAIWQAPGARCGQCHGKDQKKKP